MQKIKYYNGRNKLDMRHVGFHGNVDLSTFRSFVISFWVIFEEIEVRKSQLE